MKGAGAMRAILYARVSTDRQAERYGLEVQRQMLRKRAAERGYDVVGDGSEDIFVDDESGGTLDRPGWRRVEEVAERGLADVLIILDPDRLSRDLTNMLLVERRMQALGLRLEFLTQEFDASPLGRAFFQMRGVFAEMERNMIRERTMRGRREKARQGRVVNPGKLPSWLRSDDGGATVRLDEQWASVARMVFRLFVEEGKTLRAIAAHLHDMGLATPSGRGTHWQPTTLKHWLGQPAAKGTFYQLVPKTERPGRQGGAAKPSSKRADRSQGMAVAVPAIVSEAVWQAAQTRLAQNRALSSRNGKRSYPLRGLVICGSCGSHMTGANRNYIKDPAKARLYRCGRMDRVRRVDGSAQCADPASVQATALEDQVWATVAGLLRQPDLLRAELQRRREQGSPTREVLESELRTARKRRNEVPAEMDRLVEGYGKGFIPDELMQGKMASLREERGRLIARTAELEAEVQRLGADAQAEQAAVDFALQVADGLDTLDEAGRQELLRLVVREVVVHKGRVLIPIPIN